MPNSFSSLLKDCGFVRETQEDLIDLINQGATVDDVIAKIIPPGQSRTGFYTLSVYLYGYVPTKRLFDFDFYFYCDGLYQKPIQDKNGKPYILTYKYEPITDEDEPNLCHFELGVKDPETNEYIPKDTKNKSLKALVNTIYEEYLCKLVCLDPSKLKKWNTSNNNLLADCV